LNPMIRAFGTRPGLRCSNYGHLILRSLCRSIC